VSTPHAQLVSLLAEIDGVITVFKGHIENLPKKYLLEAKRTLAEIEGMKRAIEQELREPASDLSEYAKAVKSLLDDVQRRITLAQNAFQVFQRLTSLSLIGFVSSLAAMLITLLVLTLIKVLFFDEGVVFNMKGIVGVILATEFLALGICGISFVVTLFCREITAYVHWQFSLRTLLIAITLVALILGVLVLLVS
jgi:hypothetical protein